MRINMNLYDVNGQKVGECEPNRTANVSPAVVAFVEYAASDGKRYRAPVSADGRVGAGEVVR